MDLSYVVGWSICSWRHVVSILIGEWCLGNGLEKGLADKLRSPSKQPFQSSSRHPAKIHSSTTRVLRTRFSSLALSSLLMLNEVCCSCSGFDIGL